jgi:hypothetical protein
MSKRNFRIVTFSLLFAGLGCMLASLLFSQESTKRIFLGLTAVFYVAAALQIVIYKNRPNSFGPKENKNG